MDDLSRFCRQNPACPKHGLRRGEGNLSVCDRYGKQKQYRLLYCNVCKDRFSERKGTPFFQARLPPEKVVSVLEHLAEGCGVRKTERFVGVHRDTVTRLSRLAGEHASEAHDELHVAFSPENQRGPVR